MSCITDADWSLQDEDYSEYEDSDDEPYDTKEDEEAAQHLLGDIRTEMRQKN